MKVNDSRGNRMPDRWRFPASSANGAESGALLHALASLRDGDFSVRLPAGWTGTAGRIAGLVNEVAQRGERLAGELERVSRVVGKEGKVEERASAGNARGAWAEAIGSVNTLVDDLVYPSTELARVIGAVANGDLAQPMAVEKHGRPLQGQFLRTARTVNTLVNRLNSFASEVTRVACEVGTEGKLGGQATVKGLAGTWKDLTESVNSMASNLTSQVRNIAAVTTAVATGDLSKKITVDVKGEILELKNTINTMVDQLRSFASEVTRVAREVGTEGKLGGQADVRGVAGTWKALTDNVNQLAANLTTQVRAIAEVATAVTKGDLTRSINVQARGEVAALKDNLNEMIRNLKETTSKNNEQTWLKSNQAKFSRMLQGQTDLRTVGKRILSELARMVSARQGVFYIVDGSQAEPRLKLLASYACRRPAPEIRFGEGLLGQCALEKEKILLAGAPRTYLQISSGLGAAAPLNILVLPVLFEERVKGVLELASFEGFSSAHQALLDPLLESIGIVLHTIEGNRRTEDLLEQSQRQAERLRQSEERFRFLMEGVKDYAIYMLDEHGRVVSWNVGAEQVTGYGAEEIIGQHSSAFSPPEEAEPGRRDRELQTTAVQGRVEDEGWRVRKDGTRFWANVITTALRDDRGELRGYAEVIRNVSARKLLEREILDISDREQRRIGQDLHDDLCQRLAGIEMMSQFLEQKLVAGSAPEAATAIEVTKLVRHAISHTRDLARGLSPVMLESDGLVSALRELAVNAEKFFKISCLFQSDAPARGLDNAAATHLYRIAQEALSNATRHGQARRVVISLTQVQDRLRLRVQDDGVGLPESARNSPGMGLRIMQYRAGMIGGSLRVQREPGGGTSVTCALRIANENFPPQRPS